MASDGDIRVLIVLDVLLSAVFSAMALYALSLAGISEFTLRNFALGALFLAVVTYFIIIRE